MLRLRLFDDVISGFGDDCKVGPAELEAVLTPGGKGNNAFSMADDHGQDTPLSIEISVKPMIRRSGAFDVRRGLFSGKRSADSVQLRLFDDVISGFGDDCKVGPAELEAVLTPGGKGNNAFSMADDHGQDTPLSIEISVKPMIRRSGAFDVRRGLFSGKRSADTPTVGLRLRLFDDVISGFGDDCKVGPAELEAVLTPAGKGNNAFSMADDHGQDTPLSIEISVKPMIRRSGAFDVRRGLFSGKRSVD
ncbi:hypothetical protein MAR_006677, partial [Mya arenaria]